jgi:serine/threonine-protein kinase
MYFNPQSIIGKKYKIVKAIGAGGMATVYAAESLSDPSFKVALKVFYPGIIKSAEAKDRFRNEVLAAYRVPHENVIQIYECFDEDNLFAFSQELADGGDLFQRLQQGPINQKTTLKIIHQITSGLQAIHESSVIHRDIKPENILMTKSGIAKISDFGVARLTGINTPTQVGHIVGTPRYVSPEYVATGKCDQRTDIFALGILAFEMLTGKLPFPDHTSEVLSNNRFVANKRTSLQDCQIECSKELELIIERCLAINPDERYQTAQDMIDDIEHLYAGKSLAPQTLKNQKHPIFSKHTLKKIKNYWPSC